MSAESLYQDWKENPDQRRTLVLCSALGGPTHAAMIQRVGEYARNAFAEDAAVLLGVAKMYVSVSRFSDAQAVLVNAGKAAPRDGNVYRLLGEVLLRRGDAERAEKVFERALQFGVDDPDTRMWIERAKVFRAVQSRGGTGAVATEVERVSPASLRGPASSSRSDLPRSSGGGLPSSGSRNVSLRSPLPPPPPRENAPPSFAQKSALTPIPPELFKTPPPAQTRPRSTPPPPPSKLRSTPPPAPAKAKATGLGQEPFEPLRNMPGSTIVTQAVPPPGHHEGERKSVPPPIVSGGTLLGVAPVPTIKRSPFAREPAHSDASIMFDLSTAPSAPGSSARSVDNDLPDPRDVLSALHQAGVFESNSDAANFAWYRPKRTFSWPGPVFLSLIAVGLVGAGVGTFRYVENARARDQREAWQMVGEAEITLERAKVSDLDPVGKTFSRIFDLDSRSGGAALVWLHQKTMVGYLTREEPTAIEQAMKRVEETLPPTLKGDARAQEAAKTTAFAQVASYLFHGDLGGALPLLPRYDALNREDGWYQFFSGVALERAGDQGARKRYEEASRLLPSFIAPQMALVRYLAIERSSASAEPLLKEFRARFPDRIESEALTALVWLRSPARSTTVPKEVEITLARASELPAPLAVVPYIARALMALDKRELDTVRKEIRGALGVVDGPGIASWIGSIAIAADDEALARTAALSAVAYNAAYSPARVLAARVALAENRLEESSKAIEGLESSLPDVGIVRACIAYEKLDAVGLKNAFEALPEEIRKLDLALPLSQASAVLDGTSKLPRDKLVKQIGSDAPWSDLVLMDLALDRNDLESAELIRLRWKGSETRPLRAIRLARLFRYQGKIEDAETFSTYGSGAPTLRGMQERVLTLIARGKGQEVPALVNRFQFVFRDLAPWYSAYGAASAGKIEDARSKISSLEVPLGAPVPVKIVIVGALGAVKDMKKSFQIARPMFEYGIAAPEILPAGKLFGMGPMPTP